MKSQKGGRKTKKKTQKRRKQMGKGQQKGRGRKGNGSLTKRVKKGRKMARLSDMITPKTQLELYQERLT